MQQRRITVFAALSQLYRKSIDHKVNTPVEHEYQMNL